MKEPVYSPRIQSETLSYYRNTSCGFAAKARLFIINRDGLNCNYCRSSENPQIDHIVSVWLAHKYSVSVYELNDIKNLQILCAKCNLKKSPNYLEGFVYKLHKNRTALTIDNILAGIEDD